MKNLFAYARAGLLALAMLLVGSVFLASPAPAQDTTTPEPVTVGASFGDNVCVGDVYTEPTLDAPDYPGTSKDVTGTVEPGGTVTVTYTALTGYVIEGQSVFTHTYPAEPASVTDCEKSDQPEPEVTDRSRERTDCDGIERREWQIVREYEWNGDEWVLGAPQVVNDTGWVFVRDLSLAEQDALGCLEVEGEQETDTSVDQGGHDEQQPTVEVAPDQGTPDVEVLPTSVDAGLSGDSVTGDPVVAPAGPRWLAPLLGGVILLGFAGFWRLKGLAAA